MKPGTIYRKTMIFSWMKLGLGLVTVFVCLIVGAVAWLVITHVQLDMLTSIAIGCAAFLIAIGIYYGMMSRIGYSIKLGQLAIVERAHGGQDIPSNPVEFSKTVLKARFQSNRQYHVMARNLMLDITQIVRVISRGFSLHSDMPETGFGRLFLSVLSYPALSCMDECCMTYALRRKDYEVHAACVDALTILAQNWDRFRKQAIKLSLIVILIWILLMALFFLPGWAVAQSLSVSFWPWLGVSFFLVMTCHFAFIDSWILTKIVCGYLDIAQDTQIESKNYKKLDSWSKAYAKMRKEAETIAEKAEDTADHKLRAEKKTKAALTAETTETAETAENLQHVSEGITETTAGDGETSASAELLPPEASTSAEAIDVPEDEAIQSAEMTHATDKSKMTPKDIP
jgi:hypothetical protein